MGGGGRQPWESAGQRGVNEKELLRGPEPVLRQRASHCYPQGLALLSAAPGRRQGPLRRASDEWRAGPQTVGRDTQLANQELQLRTRPRGFSPPLLLTYSQGPSLCPSLPLPGNNGDAIWVDLATWTRDSKQKPTTLNTGAGTTRESAGIHGKKYFLIKSSYSGEDPAFFPKERESIFRDKHRRRASLPLCRTFHRLSLFES